jgi:hypothetical protein
MKLAAQIKSHKGEGGRRERERERYGAPKSNVLTSRSSVANPKSGPDYSVFIMK